MFLKFIRLEFKSFFRSASMGRDIGLKIFLGFLAVYMLISFLAMGFALYDLLKELIPDKNPLQVVNGMILGWIILELFVRFFLQKLPAVSIKPLLVQPVQRKTIINFVLFKSVFSFFNLLGLIVFIPFVAICASHGLLTPIQAVFWGVAIIGFILCINFTNFLISDKFSDNIKGLLPYLAIILVLVGLSYFKVFDFTAAISQGMDFMIANPVLAFIPLLLAVGLYFLNYKNLKAKFYLDRSLQSKVSEAKQLNLGWLDKFGPLASFIKLDVKLLIRNKRPRATLLMAVFFLAYGLIFYTNKELQGDFIKVFLGIFMTGIFIINFGQFIPAWDSNYYPLMMTQNIPMKEYFRSKIALMNLSILILFLGSLPYAYFGYDIIFVHLATALFNAGINIPIILFFGSYNKKRIDLERGAMLNYQGTGAAQWLLAIPILGLPLLIWFVASQSFSPSVATAILGGLGILGIAFNRQILDFITLAYKERKYAALEGFQQKDN